MMNSVLLPFFLLTFLSAWVLWGIAIAGGLPTSGAAGMLLYMAGGFAPSIVGVVVMLRKYDAQARQDYWRRLLDARRIRPTWWLLCLLCTPLMIWLAIRLDVLLGASAPDMPGLKSLLAQPINIPIMIVMMIIGGALSEELGWRGLALEELQKKFSSFWASAILAPVWWIWHLPLFSLLGTNHHNWGWFSPMFWLFLPTVICLNFFVTLAYNRNRSSTLSSILFHFSFNFSLSLVMPISLRAWAIMVALLVATTAGLWLTTQSPYPMLTISPQQTGK